MNFCMLVASPEQAGILPGETERLPKPLVRA